ncbi:phosphopantetheine-binding protein [Nocardia sp. NPDC050406]|uniref:phosphopantetheine-binding protein n=1 Tax=Nocardia sp. NPDC050406 TaxID=3364318 RepID=UPI0037949E8E
MVAIEASTHPADAEWNPRPSPQPRPSPPRVNGHNTSDTSGLPTPPPTRPASHDASTATDVPTASPTHVDGHRAPSTNGLPVHSPTRVDSADTPRANGLPTPSPTRVDSPGAPGASGLPNPSPTHANGHGASSASGLLAPWPTRVDGPGAPDASGLPAPSPTRVDNHGAPESSGLPAPSPTHVDSHGAPETSGLPAPSQTRGGSHDAPGASGKPAPSRVESHVASGWGGLLVHVLADFRARCADRGRAVLSPRSGGPGARCRSGIAVAREVARLSGLPVSAVRVCVVASIPRLPNGKPDYPAIRRLSGVREVQTADVRALFGQALGIDARSIGGSATFADLGGDSLTYVGLSMRLEHALGQLPVQWPTMTVAELEALPRRHHRFGRSVDTGTLLRALAIVAVVGSHIGLFVLWGGAHVLLAVAGFNFARFAVTAAPAAARLRRTLRSVAFIAVPTALWVLATLPFGDYYGWQNVLLLNKILGPHDSPTAGHLWFVEVLVYLVLAAALLLRLPVADRLERLSPFWFASGLLALSLIFRYRSFDLYAPQDVPFSPLVCWFFLLGWAAAKATTAWHRLLLSILAVADIPGYFNETDRELMILAGILLLVWLPSVRMPALLAGPVALVADAALFTYLLHWQVYPLFGQHHLLALMGSLAAGMAAAKVMAWARAAVASAPGSAGPVDGPNLSLRLLGQFRDQDISRNRLASKVIE